MPTAWQRERAAEAISSLCTSRLDPATFRQELAVLLKRAVPFDSCALVACDPATETAVSFYIEDSDLKFVPAVIRNEYLERDFNKFDALARGLWPVGILSDATQGKRERSPRYCNILVPQGKEYELRASCVVDSARWGSITLNRDRGRPDFNQDDAAVIARFAGQIGKALRRGILSAVLEGPGDERAGVVMLDNENRIEALTPAGERWLAELDEGGALPGAVYQIAVRARDEIDGTPIPTPRLRVLTRSGRWVVVHGSRLGERIAVVIEAARPAEIAPLLLAAHDLSARERDVANLLLAGCGTKEIALILELSPYTVQDHLKAIFEKTGVHSRGELAARVLGGRHARNDRA